MALGAAPDVRVMVSPGGVMTNRRRIGIGVAVPPARRAEPSLPAPELGPPGLGVRSHVLSVALGAGLIPRAGRAPGSHAGAEMK
jgi:hypothetical protein